MKDEGDVIALIDKAERSLDAADALFKREDYDFAVSRAYYSMFYCAEALLLSRDMSFSRHSAVISSFGKEFVKTGIMDKEMHTYLIDAFRKRQVGDYDFVIYPTREECEDILKNTGIFLEKTREYLKLKNS